MRELPYRVHAAGRLHGVEELVDHGLDARAHPLDDADNTHDWSLSPGQAVGFSILMNLFSETPSCNFGPECQTLTNFPDQSFNGELATGYADLVEVTVAREDVHFRLPREVASA